jgi:dinuclear metal center YbgI/SA1388 family protein
MMTTVDQICSRLSEMAPLKLAEDWDNVGLLVGDRCASVNCIMTCLTITPAVAYEAVQKDVDLLIAHHPLPFKPLSKVTSDTIAGKILLKLIEGKVAVYSAHTAFDTAAEGINAMWASMLGLQAIEPLSEPAPAALKLAAGALGAGRRGKLSEKTPLRDLAIKAARAVNQRFTQIVGSESQPVSRVAIACGSGGSFLAAAARSGCECLVTGEATFHTCLEAEALGIGLILLGHFSSERFAMERLAAELGKNFPSVPCFTSLCDVDPLQLIECKI